MLENGHLSLNKLIFNLNALVDLGEVVKSYSGFKTTIKSSLYLVMGTLSISKGVIFQFDGNKDVLKILSSKGIDGLTNTIHKLKKKEINELIETKTIIERDNAAGYIKDLFDREKALLDKIMASILVPLVVKDEFVGLMALGRKFSRDKYSKNDYEILAVMAHQIAVSLHNHNLLLKLAAKVSENEKIYKELRLIYYDTIEAFATAIDAKDAYTKGHSSRVSKYCVFIANEMGFSEQQIEGIKIAGYLHDIGKLAIDNGIINKPAKLTKEEKLELDQHPVISYEILAKIRFPWKDISNDVRYHHEHLNGMGYPDRLRGEKIPVGAKILSLADAFDAMTSDRPYRKKLNLETTFIEIKRSLGSQFDPEVVQHFFQFIKKDIKGDNQAAFVYDLEPTVNIQKIEKYLD